MTFTEREFRVAALAFVAGSLFASGIFVSAGRREAKIANSRVVKAGGKRLFPIDEKLATRYFEIEDGWVMPPVDAAKDKRYPSVRDFTALYEIGGEIVSDYQLSEPLMGGADTTPRWTVEHDNKQIDARFAELTKSLSAADRFEIRQVENWRRSSRRRSEPFIPLAPTIVPDEDPGRLLKLDEKLAARIDALSFSSDDACQKERDESTTKLKDAVWGTADQHELEDSRLLARLITLASSLSTGNYYELLWLRQCLELRAWSTGFDKGWIAAKEDTKEHAIANTDDVVDKPDALSTDTLAKAVVAKPVAPKKPARPGARADIVLVDTAAKSSLSGKYNKIFGRVKNISDRDIWINVEIMLETPTGALLETRTDLVRPYPLGPGETGTFEASGEAVAPANHVKYNFHEVGGKSIPWRR